MNGRLLKVQVCCEKIILKTTTTMKTVGTNTYYYYVYVHVYKL